MWGIAASVGLSVIGAYSQGAVAKAQAQANNRVDAARAKATNRVRGAGNAFSAAKGALARYMQSVNNNESLHAGGTALEANLVNARRQDDQLAKSSFEDQIKATEQLGAQAAGAAFAGAAGGAADMVSMSTRLMQQRASVEALQVREFGRFDTAQRAGVIQSQTVRSLDQSLIFDALDHSIAVGNVQKATNPWALAALAGVSTLAKTGIPSFGTGANTVSSGWVKAGGTDQNYYGGGI